MQDIIDELGLPDVVFHSLRHTSAVSYTHLDVYKRQLLCYSAELGHRGRHEKETAAGKISMWAIIKNINWRLSSFLYSGRAGMYQYSRSEGAVCHRR